MGGLVGRSWIVTRANPRPPSSGHRPPWRAGAWRVRWTGCRGHP